MAGNPNIDRLETLECVERNGVIRKLVRVCRVFGLASTDYRVLWQGLSKAGIPTYGASAIDTTSPATITATQAFNALVLVERTAKVAESDPGTVDVTLTYEHLLDGPNQNIPGRKLLYVKSRSSVVQKPANFFYPFGDPTASTAPVPILNVTQFGAGGPIIITIAPNFFVSNNTGVVVSGVTGTTEANGDWTVSIIGAGQLVLTGSVFVNAWAGGGQLALAAGTAAPRIQILTGHKFPLDDRDFKGLIVIQGGEISLPYPQENIRLEGYTYTASPRTVKDTIHRKLNQNSWLGKPPRSWLCTEVQYDVLDPSPIVTPVGIPTGTPLYRFEFEIQYDSDTWDQTVAFKDSRTGLPPSSSQIGVAPDPQASTVLNQQVDPTTSQIFPAGYWQVPALPQIDFGLFFQANFDGDS